jgi:hypothetical protein
MTKVLVTAEAFGFGPASKLHAIGVELARRGIEAHFVGSAAALTFATSNADTYASITPMDEMTALAAIDPDGYDAAISVMDPFLPLWSTMHGIPCVYVDSLYWFWQWYPERERELQEQAAVLRSLSDVAKALAALDAIPMHDGQYIAHHLSTVNCAQRAPRAAARTRTIRGVENVHVVDAIIDLSHRRPAPPRQWLATTSGMVNPLLPEDLAVEWVRIVARLLEEAADASGVDEPIVLAGNPVILGLAGDVASDRIRPTPMGHRAMLRAMNDSFACLTPPGLTTLMEGAAYGVPILFLPGQHYAHLSNYHEIVACGDPDAFPHGLATAARNGSNGGPSNRGSSDGGSSDGGLWNGGSSNGGSSNGGSSNGGSSNGGSSNGGSSNGGSSDAATPLDGTLSVSDHLRHQYAERGEVWSRMVSGLAAGMRRVREDRRALCTAQDRVVRSFVGGYGGTAQVVDLVQSAVDRARSMSRS